MLWEEEIKLIIIIYIYKYNVDNKCKKYKKVFYIIYNIKYI